MTTIATDGKVMVADSRAVGSYAYTVQKIRRLKDGRVIGIAGEFQWFDPIARYYETGKDKPACHEADFCILMLHPSGRVEYAENNLSLGKVRPPIAIGSGAAYAMGAIKAGASVAKAVAIAAQLDHMSGGPIRTLKR